MKALSWKEPYGSMMLHGKIETRTWKTNVRGPILICCSKKAYTGFQVADISGSFQLIKINLKLFGEAAPTTRSKDLWIGNSGLAIAIGILTDCVPMQPDDETDTFVRYYPDLWCHVYEDVIALPKPFHVQGQMGFFNVPDERFGINLLEWYKQQLNIRL